MSAEFGSDHFVRTGRHARSSTASRIARSTSWLTRRRGRTLRCAKDQQFQGQSPHARDTQDDRSIFHGGRMRPRRADPVCPLEAGGNEIASCAEPTKGSSDADFGSTDTREWDRGRSTINSVGAEGDGNSRAVSRNVSNDWDGRCLAPWLRALIRIMLSCQGLDDIMEPHFLAL